MGTSDDGKIFFDGANRGLRISVLPFYDVKCLCSGGRDEGGRKATPTSTSIFDFYGIKALLFEFGNNIFTGFKMPRL